MGMSDDMDSIAIAMNGIESSIESSKSVISDYIGDIQSAAVENATVENIERALKHSYSQIRPVFDKYETGIEEESDANLKNRFFDIAMQAMSGIRISGKFTGAEGRLIFELHGDFIVKIKNTLNDIRVSGKSLPSDISGMVEKQITAIESAKANTAWVDSGGGTYFSTIDQSIKWVKEVIKKRRETFPYAIKQYASAKNTLQFLKDFRDGKQAEYSYDGDALDAQSKVTSSIDPKKIISMIDTAIKIYEALERIKTNSYSEYNKIQIKKLNEYRRIFTDFAANKYDTTNPNVVLFLAQKAVEVSEILESIAIQFFSDFEYRKKSSAFYTELENAGVTDQDVVDLLDLYESGLTADAAKRAGISGTQSVAQSSQLKSLYTIQIVADNKLQTITTLNDPADFLAALTGN